MRLLPRLRLGTNAATPAAPPAAAPRPGPAAASAASRSVTVRVGAGPAVTLAEGAAATGVGSMVDVAIAFDTTGSMSSKIDGLVACAAAMVRTLDGTGLDWRLTAVPFGDLLVFGDTIDESLPWCADVAVAEASLRSMRRNSGGGNDGESSFEAVLAAARKVGRQGALRVVLLVTDEPPLTHTVGAGQVLDELRGRDVLCSVISPDRDDFRSFAEMTGGTWLLIGSSVDMRSLVEAWGRLGGAIATRVRAVVEFGGSPQRALELEAGR